MGFCELFFVHALSVFVEEQVFFFQLVMQKSLKLNITVFQLHMFLNGHL